MKFTTLKYEISDAVATITLDRPQVLNAMNRELMDDFNNVFEIAGADRAVRAVVLTGAGRGFCSGADLKSLFAEPEAGEPIIFKSYLRRVNELIIRIMRLEKPVIAAVNGPAVGAGCNIALACDIIYMGREAYLSEIFVKRGLVPDFGGLYLLTRYVGLAKAKELIFTGERVSGDEALKLGIVNRVFTAKRLLPEAMKFARQMAAGPTAAIALAKLGIHRGLDGGMDAVLEYEALAQAVIRTTGDTFEALSAFLEKREPKFQGK
ncbi:enoyl-CoA hydratase/isomerase family protein [Candidatus Poribacteria bacterium]|nr:enoyl-CoA hydratase/isomerase family protein [Candidatus Poribacteria bacterium]